MTDTLRTRARRVLSRWVYLLARQLYRPLKKVFKPFVVRRPRLHHFALAVKGPLKNLLRSPEAVSSERGGPIPEWLIDEWKAAHEVDPRIYPESWILETIPFYSYDMPDSDLGDSYLTLGNSYGKNVSHVFLVPWLLTGGADLVTLNYIRALASAGFSESIVVIITLDAASPWAARLPEGVRFIEFGKSYFHLAPDEQEKLLARLFLQMAPRVIHNINSDLGYRVFVRYGKALSVYSRLYVSSFCIDLGLDGNLSGYPVWYLPKCFDYLTAVFSDNRTHLNALCDYYAFDMDKMFVHYQPMALPERAAMSGGVMAKQRLDILWAGRLDKQKRPDILLSVAKKCTHLPVTFHVYGSSVMDIDSYIDDFLKLQNVEYHGGFDGLHSLPTDRYDLFLYTSQWDGLPNVLLEAMSLGLPVIASNTGGIAELISDKETGFLITPYDDADKFAERIQEILLDRSVFKNIADSAYALVASRHSSRAFTQELQKQYGYFCTGDKMIAEGI